MLTYLRRRPLFDVYAPQAAWFAQCTGITVPSLQDLSLERADVPPATVSLFPRFGAVHRMRLQIRAMLQYLMSCTIAKGLRLLRQLTLVNRAHFLESDSLYSLADLEEGLMHDTLHDQIWAILDNFKAHVRTCEVGSDLSVKLLSAYS